VIFFLWNKITIKKLVHAKLTAISSLIYDFSSPRSHTTWYFFFIHMFPSLTSFLTLVWNYFSPAKALLFGTNGIKRDWTVSGKKYRCTPRSILRFNNTRCTSTRCTSAISRRWICSHNRLPFENIRLFDLARIAKSDMSETVGVFREMFQMLLWNLWKIVATNATDVDLVINMILRRR